MELEDPGKNKAIKEPKTPKALKKPKELKKPKALKEPNELEEQPFSTSLLFSYRGTLYFCRRGPCSTAASSALKVPTAARR